MLSLTRWSNYTQFLIKLLDQMAEENQNEKNRDDIMNGLLAADLLEAIQKRKLPIDKIMQLILSVSTQDTNKWKLLLLLSKVEVNYAITDDIIPIDLFTLRSRHSSMNFFDANESLFQSHLLALIIQLMSPHVIEIMRQGRLSSMQILVLINDNLEYTVALLKLLLQMPSEYNRKKGWFDKIKDGEISFHQIVSIAQERRVKDTYKLLLQIQSSKFFSSDMSLKLKNILIAAQYNSDIVYFTKLIASEDDKKIDELISAAINYHEKNTINLIKP
jgi:hypothetical protein